MDRYPPAVQRPALLAFAAALGSRDNALRRDECGDWRIDGKHGHIYAIPGGFQFFVLAGATKAWTYAKRALGFAKLCNDGDDEGGFTLDRLPTKGEAEIIRRYCGIDKHIEFSPEHFARLQARAKEWSKNRPRPPAPVDIQQAPT